MIRPSEKDFNSIRFEPFLFYRTRVWDSFAYLLFKKILVTFANFLSCFKCTILPTRLLECSKYEKLQLFLQKHLMLKMFTLYFNNLGKFFPSLN